MSSKQLLYILAIPLLITGIGLIAYFFVSSPTFGVFSPSQSLDDKPHLKEFHQFHCASISKNIDIVEMVAYDCKKFGIVLELSNDLVTNTISSTPGRIEDKCRNVILEWLQGKGKHPVTWRTFLSALEVGMGLRELHDSIMSELTRRSR